MTTTDALAALDRRIVAEAVDAVAIAGRLDQFVSDAVEAAPRVACWWAGRLALMRLGDGSDASSPQAAGVVRGGLGAASAATPRP
jgi:hypothetical protein